MDIDVSKGFELACFHYKVESGDTSNADLVSRAIYGEHHDVGRKVVISTDYGKEQYHSTFIHECIEGVNSTYCNSKLKHEEITNIANGISQILKSLGVIFTYGGK